MLQVVLEGLWQEGFMAIAAIGATSIGSIEVILLLLGDDIKTDQEMKKMVWGAGKNIYNVKREVLLATLIKVGNRLHVDASFRPS